MDSEAEVVKVSYRDGEAHNREPYFSTAYLDHEVPINGLFYGVNKHTEERVVVRWNEDEGQWEKAGELLGPAERWRAWWIQ